MPAHIDIVKEDLRQLQMQKREAECAALSRGTTLLPEVRAAFEEKLRVAEARVVTAETVLAAGQEVQDLLQRRGPKRSHQEREEGHQARTLPQVDLPSLAASGPAHQQRGDTMANSASSGEGAEAQLQWHLAAAVVAPLAIGDNVADVSAQPAAQVTLEIDRTPTAMHEDLDEHMDDTRSQHGRRTLSETARQGDATRMRTATRRRSTSADRTKCERRRGPQPEGGANDSREGRRRERTPRGNAVLDGNVREHLRDYRRECRESGTDIVLG